jgi:hypothetical protein
MAGVYTVLAIVSETDTSGKAWMAVGFGFVLVVWLVFRILVENAGLSRALAVGDADRLLALANKQLARRRGDPARAPYLIYRGLAQELRGEWDAALAAVREAKPANAAHVLLAASVRVTALIGRGEAAEARRVLDAELEPASTKVDRRLQPMPHARATFARARVLLAEGKRDEGRAELQRVIDDIRTGDALRAGARALLSP